MLFRTLATTTTLIIASTADAQMPQPTYSRDAVKAECSTKWGTEYDMVKYCMDQRAEGFDYFRQATEVVGDIFAPTLNHCSEKWGHEWDMTAYCAKEQLSAAQSIYDNTQGLPKPVGDKILVQCSAKWDPQWDMVAYCMRQRADAWKDING